MAEDYYSDEYSVNWFARVVLPRLFLFSIACAVVLLFLCFSSVPFQLNLGFLSNQLPYSQAPTTVLFVLSPDMVVLLSTGFLVPQ